MQYQRGLVSVGVLIAIMVGFAVLGSGAYHVVHQQSAAQTPAENFNNLQQLPTNNTQTQSVPTQPRLRTFKSETGFQFKYPSAWKVTGTEQARKSDQLLARVVNPARAGKPDTDVPIEQFLVRRMDVPCQGSATTFAGKKAYDTGWTVGFGGLGWSHRSICVQTGGWPIHIDGSAGDQASKTIMDAIFVSFAWTQ